MTNTHDPVSFPTDPHPVRPGTSAALTARTIDATVHPPLVQAQETVAALIPRLTAPLSSPLFVATLAGTLVLLWLAMRMRARLGPVLLSAMLLMTLTSFRPVRSSEEAQIVDDVIAEDDERSERIMQDEELRAAIEELRLRIEAELRHRGEHRYYEVRSARWIRRLPPSLQEWVVVGQQAVAARDRDP